MSADISRDRQVLHLRHRINEVEYGKAVEQALQTERARVQHAAELQSGLRDFQAVRAAVKSELEKSRPPQAALEAARNFLGLMKGAAGRVVQLRQALDSIELEHGQQLAAVQQKKQVNEVLDERMKKLDNLLELRQRNGEEEALEELHAARQVLRTNGEGGLDPLLPSAAVPEVAATLSGIYTFGGEAGGPPPGPESAKPQVKAQAPAQPTPGSYAEKIEQLVSQDSAERSTLSLLLKDEGGAATAIEITRRGQQSLAVKLVAETEGERRRLWARREKLISALTAAGYSVERVVLGAGGQRDK